MKRLKIFTVILIMLVTGCNTEYASSKEQSVSFRESMSDQSQGEYSDINSSEYSSALELTAEIIQLENGLSAVKYEGDYGFEEFLANGGASSDEEVVGFLSENVLMGAGGLSLGDMPFGCSTISVANEKGEHLFGRNFDWVGCNALIVHSVPQNGYSSISTVNTDFIKMSGIKLSDLPDNARAIIAMYAPLDGMNEKGLAVSVNMIQDSAAVSQNTVKPDITTTTAIRLLLNRAANVDEALRLLEGYDMHSSMGFMTHLAIADNAGNSVVVEYINNEMQVVKTPVVTNFYLAGGEKHGVGTAQSHERYDILMKALDEKPAMDIDDVRNALSSVSKGNFGEFESTEWSIIFNQSSGEVFYYHRENYDKRYTFSIKRGAE